MSFRCGGTAAGPATCGTVTASTGQSWGINSSEAYSVQTVLFAPTGYYTNIDIILVSSAWNRGDYVRIPAGDPTQVQLFAHGPLGITTVISATGVISVAQWQTFTMVRESLTLLKLYVDGVLVATNTGDMTGRPAMGNASCGLGNFYINTAGIEVYCASVKVNNTTAWDADQVALEGLALVPHPDSNCSSWFDCRQVANTEGVVPSDKFGNYTCNSAALERYTFDPQHIPYWRQYAQGLVQS